MECVCNGAIAQDEGGMDYCRIAVENSNLKIENKRLTRVSDEYDRCIADCGSLENVALREENELLKKKMKELQELGCFISDETGHKCLLATENEKLSKALKEILKEVGTSTLANKIAQQALKEGE